MGPTSTAGSSHQPTPSGPWHSVPSVRCAESLPSWSQHTVLCELCAHFIPRLSVSSNSAFSTASSSLRSSISASASQFLMARHLSVPSISSLAMEVQRVVRLYTSSLAPHCLHAGVGSPTAALSTVRSLLAAASDYMDGKLQDDLDQVLRIASTCSDEILQDATDWVISVNSDIHSLILEVLDHIESRSAQPTSLWPPSSPSSPPQSSTPPSTGPLSRRNRGCGRSRHGWRRSR